MEINFIVSDEDYIRYNLFHHAHSPSSKRMLGLLRFGAPAIIVIITLLMGGLRSPLMWVGPVIIIVVWLIIYPQMFRNSIAKNVKKLMREGRTAEFVGNFTLMLTNTGIRLIGNGQVADTAYDRVEKITADKERLYVYIGSLTAHIIPLTAFKDESHKQEFLALLKQKAPNAQNLL